MAQYQVPAEEVRRAIMVVNSRFIATLAPAASVEQARAFIARVRQEFPDATHHVPVFLVGGGDSVIEHCSDAGEPAGTAGRPALAVLRGSGLGDVVVVITRYFGGTKLGTGGLVRAYSEAMRTVIDAAPRAHKVLTHTVMLDLPYRLLERLRLLIKAQQGEILDETFGEQVTLTTRFPVDYLPAFEQALGELSNGTLQAEIVDTSLVLLRCS